MRVYHAAACSLPCCSLCVQVLSVGFLIVLFVFVYEHAPRADGLGWRGSDNFFNAHAFFMSMAVGFFLTNAVITWRDLAHVMSSVDNATQ